MGDSKGPELTSLTVPASRPRSPASATPADLVGDVLGERYQVKEVIGRGGMGVVLRAYDRALDGDVAVKLLRPELQPERRWAERLAREVRLARQISHPNVCRVFDFEQAEGHVFLVMELAAGTLGTELASGELASRGFAARLAEARAVAAGLAAIHEAGVVHGDVSPQNVLRMADGRLVVSDFGLAREPTDTTTFHGGTVAYMAPEIVLGGRASFASDVWSLGVVAHEMLFGSRPAWRADARGEHLVRPIPLTSKAERDGFEICRALLTKSLAERPRDGREALLVFDGRRRRHFLVQRRRGLVLGGVAVTLVGAAVGGAVFVLQGLIARQSSAEPEPIPITGTPTDWTSSSRLLATLPGKVHCLITLPDQRTVRYVWGYPRTAEDLDLQTGRRVPAPVVPMAHAHGCPVPSPNGRQLAFEGYDDSGRPAIFLSGHPDGSDARAVTPAAHPTVRSEPTWIDDGRAFAFDLDWRHMGAFLLNDGRTLILPTRSDATRGLYTLIRAAHRDRIFIAHIQYDADGYIDAIDWPSLNRQLPMRLPIGSLNWVTSDGVHLYSTDPDTGAIVEVTPSKRTVRRVGFYRAREPVWVSANAGGVITVTTHAHGDAWLSLSDGRSARVTHYGDVRKAILCHGSQLLIARGGIETKWKWFRVSLNGGAAVALDIPRRALATCSTRSSLWWVGVFNEDTPGSDLFRCTGSTFTSCARIGARQNPVDLSVSPDESLIALTTANLRGSVSVHILPSGGGAARELVETETACSPVWSSNRTLWVSRRQRGAVVWVETDVETRLPTGRTLPGGTACSDGNIDPASPSPDGLRVKVDYTSDVFFKAWRPTTPAGL